MRKNGQTIYLKAKVNELVKRLNGSINRPLIKNQDIRDTLEKILVKRKKKYESIANISVTTDGLTPSEVSSAILKTVIRNNKC